MRHRFQAGQGVHLRTRPRAHSMKSFTTGVSVRFFSVMTPTGQGSTTCPRVVSGARGRMALAPEGRVGGANLAPTKHGASWIARISRPPP